ncbi:MAG: hypothetical protein ABI867_40600 [Kofleriaceae bacterium]
MVRLAIIAVVLSACATFESEEIVLDMRVLAMVGTPPDQLVEIDLNNPPEPITLLDQLEEATMCALVADPTAEQRLHYTFTLCVLDRDERCLEDSKVLLKEAVSEDPDTAPMVDGTPPQMCVTVPVDGNLAGVVLQALEGDVLGGLAGVDYGVALTVGAEGGDPALDLFAGKTLRVVPNIPVTRTANQNPPETPFTGAKDGVDPQPLPMGRCVDQVAPLELVPTQRVRLEPVEPEGAREVYIAPTIDGVGEQFTESLTYQWLANAGGIDGGSGGPRDPTTGNPAPLFSDFRAPPADELFGPTDISIWIVQRDERLGSRWYETCVRVIP